MKKELLKENIEEERRKLDGIITRGGSLEEIYPQSLLLDHLIEQYLDA